MINKEKIRLLIFIPTLECGGSEKYISVLCNNINTDTFTVCLAVVNNKNPFYEITNKSVEVIDLEQSRVLFSLGKLNGLVKKYRPDIILTAANHLNLYFAVFRRMFPSKIKMLARESSIVSINSRRAKFPLIYNQLIKKYYKRFDIILCQSLYMKRDMMANYNIPGNKLPVIHNPVHEFTGEIYLPRQGADRVYKFITVARLSEEKGIERLIHAIGLLSLPFEFYIIGDGDKRKYLQNLVLGLGLESKVFFMGRRAEPFLGMTDADLFLMGSYYEGFPNVLLEAGSLGIPVIAFNAPGGIPEIITEGENGFLADDNDLIGFAAAIKKALSLDIDRNKIAREVQKRFQLNKIMAETEALLLSIGRHGGNKLNK